MCAHAAHFLRLGIHMASSFVLTHEQYLMLELIADRPVPAIPELQRHTTQLATAKLIALTSDVQWQITQLGKAMLERMQHPVH